MEQDKKKVLIVEDDEALCSLLSFRFAKRGFDVARAYNGEKALEYLKAAKFDLMMLDIQMPLMDGFELLARLKAGESQYPGATIMLTALPDESEVLEAFSLGAVDYIAKPFSMDVLMVRVDIALKFKSGLHKSVAAKT